MPIFSRFLFWKDARERDSSGDSPKKSTPRTCLHPLPFGQDERLRFAAERLGARAWASSRAPECKLVEFLSCSLGFRCYSSALALCVTVYRSLATIIDATSN